MDTLAKRVAGRIADAIHPDKIILFGSRTKGTATPESEVDLVVIYSGPKSTREVGVESVDKFVGIRTMRMNNDNA